MRNRQKHTPLAVLFLSTALCLYPQDTGPYEEALSATMLFPFSIPSPPPPMEEEKEEIEKEMENIAEDAEQEAQEAAVEEKTPQEPPRPRRFPKITGGFFGALLNYIDNPQAKTRHLTPHRYVDIALPGFVSLGLANNFVTVNDILTKTIVLDLEEIKNRVPEKPGAALSFSIDAPKIFEFNINAGKDRLWGGGISAGVYGGIDLTLPKQLFEFLANGNEGRPEISGAFTVQGAIYAESAFQFHMPFPVKIAGERLHINISPAYYVPLVYIPTASLTYSVKNENGNLTVNAGGAFSAYSAIDRDNIGFPTAGGVDLSLNVEYPLFRRLDVGAVVKHIPLVPAAMDRGYQGSLATQDGSPIIDKNLTDNLNDFEINTPELNLGDYGPLDTITVMRPLRLDWYILFRPFKSDLLVFKPTMGGSFPLGTAAATEPYFNGLLEVQLHLGQIFALYANTGREEGLWRHRLGFDLNLRAFELNFEAGLRSQNYASSYTLGGFDLGLGLRWGF